MIKKKKNGGTAFPAQGNWANDGMTLRDFFAALAMQGIIASDTLATYKAAAKDAYLIADSLLAARGEE